MINFERYKVIEEALIPYGFTKKGDIYYYSVNILNDTFRVEITIENNKLTGKIIERAFNEEYINYKIQ
ncbi:MAG: hypothetical protein LUF02_09715 [Erysipelotrichaceae bacterium]|nr:hypothetical protein [Erysipelotrichaceae bacterium]